MLEKSSVKTSLSAAVEALKKAGETAPVQQQIDTVANALLGAYRTRDLDAKGQGLPAEAKNVMEMLRLQIQKTLSILAEKQNAEGLYVRLMEDLDVVTAFTDRIAQFYGGANLSIEEDKNAVDAMKDSLRKAREQAITNLALEKLFYAIDASESAYRSNPQMDKNIYASELESLRANIKKWEGEPSVREADPKGTEGLVSKIERLKQRLGQATKISDLQTHPKLLGEEGIATLRKAAEEIQSAQTQKEIESAIDLALQADQKILLSGKQFEGEARNFHLQITQRVATFVSKEIHRMDLEFGEASRTLSEDETRETAYAEKLLRQVELLAACFRFVKQWAGPHEEDLLERIVLHYEKVIRAAKERHAKILKRLSSNQLPQETSAELSHTAALYQKAQTFAQDLIKPREIFHEK